MRFLCFCLLLNLVFFSWVGAGYRVSKKTDKFYEKVLIIRVRQAECSLEVPDFGC